MEFPLPINIIAGTIAVITAVLVVNPPFKTEWVW